MEPLIAAVQGWVAARPHGGGAIVVKGSRFMKMERVVAALLPGTAFAADARHARNRRLHYDAGVRHLGGGHKAEARSAFLAAIRREPLFLKAWVRLAQSLV